METQKTNWQKLTSFIDEHQEFTAADIKALGIPATATNQYRFYLKKAGFIISHGKRRFSRGKTIGDISIYKVKEIGFDLELEGIG